MARSRIASLERAFVAAVTAAALLAPALHGLWTHQLAISSDGAGVTRAADAPHPVGGPAEDTCGACLASNQGRTSVRGPSEPAIAAPVATARGAAQTETSPRGILLSSSAPPRAPPVG